MAAALCAGAVSLGALGFALISQYGFGLAPCEMCHWQRWPHIGALGLAILALLLPAGLRGWAVLGAALALALTAGLGLFHAGVEQGWWPGPAGCTAGAAQAASSIEELRQALMATKPVRCDEIAWQFLGLSMAGWNAAISSLGAVATIWLLRRDLRRPKS